VTEFPEAAVKVKARQGAWDHLRHWQWARHQKIKMIKIESRA